MKDEYKPLHVIGVLPLAPQLWAKRAPAPKPFPASIFLSFRVSLMRNGHVRRGRSYDENITNATADADVEFLQAAPHFARHQPAEEDADVYRRRRRPPGVCLSSVVRATSLVFSLVQSVISYVNPSSSLSSE